MHLLTYACAGNKDPDHLISVCYSCYQAEHTPPPHPLYA
jgi:hypothetical protein